jgi:predicted PurR-regulated permease PerM
VKEVRESAKPDLSARTASVEGRPGPATSDRSQDPSTTNPPTTNPPTTKRRGYFSGVPFPTILATIGIFASLYVLVGMLDRISNAITWILVATFFAIVLTPVVDILTKRFHLRKGLAATLVFLLGIGTIVFLGYVFINPLAKQATYFSKNFSTYLKDAQEGRGEVGKLVKKWKIDQWVEKNQDDINKRAGEFFSPKKILGTTTTAIGSVFNVVIGTLTIAVMTFLMLLEGRALLLSATKLLRPHQRERAIRLARASSHAVTGYVAGNVAISVIAGLASYIFLIILGVPFAGVLALWVAFADLIPLVGATVGAVPAVFVAFLQSTTVGIVTVVFFIIYQQFENHVLQTTIMARTVALKPLVVLVSVLIGVELFGLLGALLSIPLAGVIKVVGADLIAEKRPDLEITPPTPPKAFFLSRK